MQRQIRLRRAKERRQRARQKERRHAKSPNNLTPGSLGDKLSKMMNSKEFLQGTILFLVMIILMMVIIFSWNNIFNQGLVRVGRIEFTTDEFLGKGCLGTSVFRGTFDGRNVAVKVNFKRFFESPTLSEENCNLFVR